MNSIILTGQFRRLMLDPFSGLAYWISAVNQKINIRDYRNQDSDINAETSIGCEASTQGENLGSTGGLIYEALLPSAALEGTLRPWMSGSTRRMLSLCRLG